MAVKQYDIRHFSATVNGQEITFRCYTTDTRSGFCHTAICTTWGIDTTPTKQTYYNRTWERFEYETVLIKAIEKLPKDLRKAVHEQIIEGKAAQVGKSATNNSRLSSVCTVPCLMRTRNGSPTPASRFTPSLMSRV